MSSDINFTPELTEAQCQGIKDCLEQRIDDCSEVNEVVHTVSALSKLMFSSSPLFTRLEMEDILESLEQAINDGLDDETDPIVTALEIIEPLLKG